MKAKEKKNKKNIFLILRLLFVFFLIVGNTFAWFIFATRIDNTVDVHVKAWNVVFEAGDSQVIDYVDLNVESVYPGMEDYNYSIKARNNGDVNATLSYEIIEARIFDTVYKSKEAKEADHEEVLPTDKTSAELVYEFEHNYPFKIFIDLSNSTITTTGTEYYTINVTWPFESNNDELDTRWGIVASNYKKGHPGKSSIALKIKIIITQNNS